MIFSPFAFPFSPRLRALLIAVALLGATTSFETARAEDWMFYRSYYTHALPQEHLERFPPPERRTAYRAAFRGTTPGFGIRGVQRFNQIQLGRGRNSDITIYRQDWFELEP